MWPFKKEKQSTVPVATEQLQKLEELFIPRKGNRLLPIGRMCPDESKPCVCRDCPKCGICAPERTCFIIGCTNFIRTCSFKALLFSNGKEKLSEMGDLIADSNMINILRHYRDDENGKEEKRRHEKERY